RYTFASRPLRTTYCSASFSPPVIEHTGSWLISILSRSGDLPSNRTVPTTDPVIAGSIAVPCACPAGPPGFVPLPITAPRRIASSGLHPAIPITTHVASRAVAGQPKILILLLSLLRNRRLHRLQHCIGKCSRPACAPHIAR